MKHIKTLWANSEFWNVIGCARGHYATGREVAVSIPNEVIGFFNSPKPPSRTMVVGSTRTLTEISTRNIPGG
jgi:hypothetical protein